MRTHLLRWTIGWVLAAFLILVNASAAAAPKNILFVLADDFGLDTLSLFNTNTGPDIDLPATPTINALAQNGVLFRNCYTFPSCSPTRASILTGRYGFRNGVGAAIGFVGDPVLSPREFTIAKALSANPQLGFRHAHIGKWHCSTNAIDPNFIGGWNHFAGFIGAEHESHYDWAKTVNGVTTPHVTNWATTEIATDAINWINAQGTNRWFLWFAPKSAHSPYDKPPNELHSYDNLPFNRPAIVPEKPYFHAAIEALDTELRRVLTNVNLAETMVVFMTDNGTPGEVIQGPYDTNHCKGSLTEGGTRVPLIFAGAGIVGTNRTSDAVIHAVDLFATLLEFAGVNLATTLPTNLVFDSRSFANVVRNEPWNPAENVILMENFGTIIPAQYWGVAARGQRYKVVKLDNGREEFYDLQTDPFETNSLLGMPPNLNNLTATQRVVYAGLTNRLAQWHNPPIAPTITRWETQLGALTLTVPEQLGIAYEVARVNSVEATNWTTVTTFVREVRTNIAEITLSVPVPAAIRFYRVTAAGR